MSDEQQNVPASACQYQWEYLMAHQTPEKDIVTWQPSFGSVVVERDGEGKAIKVRFAVLIDNPDVHVYVVGGFNNWGQADADLNGYELVHDENHMMAYLETTVVHHKDPYKFLMVQGESKRYMQDPAGVYFSDEGNTIFWDFDDPSAYKLTQPFVNTFNRPIIVMQTDLPGLIAHWADQKGVCGRDVGMHGYYRFIAESGVLEHIKELGFNTIQFLPFAQSIDGPNWKYRYLIPFQYAIQKNWGTPDEFALMVDTCHKLGIAVIGDFVVSHFPHRDYKIFGMDGETNGIHLWRSRHGYELYMKDQTSWGTMRPDFDNSFVRQFMIDSVLSFMKRYRIDGFRIDNVDGILRFGDNGEGPERPHGRLFLRDLTRTLYSYNPAALIHFEAHYFYEDNAKMLVVPYDLDERALGATAYNDSRTTYYLHKDFMIKDAKVITPWKFRDIASEKEWGQSNSTISDFHNHDAAAGLMFERCTGSYAYDAMTVDRPENHIHAIGKIKVMEALIAFASEGRILDLIQTFLLQTGTFEHDTSVQWYLTFNQVNRNTLAYKQRVNQIMQDPAFWPRYTKNRRFLNVDDTNKVLVIERSAEHEGVTSTYLIVINLSSWTHYNYKVGVRTGTTYKVELNADLFDYAGSGRISYPDTLDVHSSTSFEVLDKEIELSIVPGYAVVVLKLVA